MRRTILTVLLTTIAYGFAGLAPALMARTCSSNADVQGAYGFISAPLFAGVPVMPPGTAGSLNLASPISVFVESALQHVPASVAGTVVADGSGNLLAPSSTGSGLFTVGSYSVNADCSLSMTIQDAFNAQNSAATGVPNRSTPSVSLEGVIAGQGSQVILKQTAAAGANGATAQPGRPANPGAPGQGAPGQPGTPGQGTPGQPGTPGPGTTPPANLVLYRLTLYQSCTNASLMGSYALEASGMSSMGQGAGAAENTAFSLLGRLSADGAGNFTPDAQSTSSPLSELLMTGTYMVNPDCTGTATLMSADGQSHKISFVLVGDSSSTARMQLVLSNSGTSGSGSASQQ